MELSRDDAEIPMPINSVYGGGVLLHNGHGHGHHGHMSHHHHHQHQQEINQLQPPPQPQPQPPSLSSSPPHHQHHQIMIPSSSTITPINNGTHSTTRESVLNLEEVPYTNRVSTPQNNDNQVVVMMRVRYRECQKNHAASMGGNATDGCGEFMPSGEEGSLEFLTCSVCNCHRNFHRKENERGGGGGPLLLPPPPPPPHHGFNYHSTPYCLRGRKVILGPPNTVGGGGGGLGGVSSRAMVFGHHNLPYPSHFGGGPPYSASDDLSDGHDRTNQTFQLKKRVRTKFSQEQKEKMLEFAEKVGWKIQRQEEAVLQKFCQEVGVKRRVLKVWMHNNKLTLAKKNPHHDPNTNNPNSSLHA